MNGTAVFGERVVIVEVHSGHVSLKKGRISSTESSHVYADNRVDTVVSGERPVRPVTDSPNEACETPFRVNDIHLLKEREAHSLQDPNAVEAWFGAIYQDPLVTKIRRALKRLQADWR
jgi:hypothetical protein